MFGDIYNIGGRVKEIDPALQISWDERERLYRVCRGKHQVMTVPTGKLDNRVLMALREGDLHRFRRLEDYIEILEAREAEAERRKEQEMSDHIEAATLDKYNKIQGISQFGFSGRKAEGVDYA